MKIENASIYNISNDLILIGSFESDNFKIRQRNKKPMQTPFDKEYEEVTLNIMELQDVINSINSLKLIKTISK